MTRPAWSALLAYAAAFALVNATSALLVLAVAVERASGNAAILKDQASRFSLSAAGLMSVACTNGAVLLGVAFVAARRRGPRPTTTLRLGATRARPAGVAAAVAGMVGLSFACGTTAELLGVRAGGLMETVARTLERPTPTGLVAALITIGLVPAVAEETFFRGLLQPILASRWGSWPSIMVTSAAFGVMHGELVQGVLTFVAGLYLGWTADRLGGVRPTIAAHAVNNAAFVALSSIATAEPSSPRGRGALLAIGAAACAASVAVLRSRAAVKP